MQKKFSFNLLSNFLKNLKVEKKRSDAFIITLSLQLTTTNMTKILNKDDINIVYYHGKCSDGFGSAFSVWHYYKGKFGLEKANAIEYIPCYHNAKIIIADLVNKTKDKNVLMCDFSYKYDVLTELINSANTFLIIDHHKTAESDLAKVPKDLKIFCNTKSGCGLTWEYFFIEEVPTFLKYIQDRDIWSNVYRETTPFCTFFYEIDFNFAIWEKYLDDANVALAIQKGQMYMEYKNTMVKNIMGNCTTIIQEINDKYCLVTYCNSCQHQSDIGNKMLSKFPLTDFACVWSYNLDRGVTTFSLRSSNDKHDVSQIATMFGGGGHRNAAGLYFQTLCSNLPFPVVTDKEFMKFIRKPTFGTTILCREQFSYVLLKSLDDAPKEEWYDGKYLELIKRKFNNAGLIVFQKNAISVDSNNEIITINEFNICYNVESLTGVKQMANKIRMGDDHWITFSSDNSFEQCLRAQHGGTKVNANVEIQNQFNIYQAGNQTGMPGSQEAINHICEKSKGKPKRVKFNLANA